jgi:NAD(P)-dependent dehydrogenase (short-subunit alcohol dehydrogenase family)
LVETTEEARRVALVTGAGTGIGRAVALALLGDGYCVALVGRREDPLVATAAESAAGDRALPIRADVTDAAAVADVFRRVEERWGRLDVLFNNAGRLPPRALLEDLPLEEWQATVDVNLTGMFVCTQHALRLMKRQVPHGGRIINNGSICAHSATLATTAYTATKHGVTGLTRMTALEGRDHEIACGQIDIGNAETPMTTRSRQWAGGETPEPVFDVRHVSDAVLAMANLPLDVNVQSMTILATKLPFVGRG